MMEFQKILVPLDGSDLAERVLLSAVRLAEGIGATLTLLTVVLPLPRRPADDPVVQAVQSHAYEAGLYLKEMRSRLQPTTVEIETAVVTGSPANTIITYARQHNVSLILMTTHGRSGLTRWTFGRVAEKVLRRAPCPTVILRSHQKIVPAQIKRILVPLDGSPLAERVLGPTRRIAAALEAEVLLLRVIEPPPLLFAGEDTARSDDQPVEMQTYLEAVRARLASAGLSVRAELRRGSAADTILDYAEETAVDLIVLSNVGSSGLQLWVFGSVAERVMKGATCATLLFRHEDRPGEPIKAG